jgi:hypothetical protein
MFLCHDFFPIATFVRSSGTFRAFSIDTIIIDTIIISLSRNFWMSTPEKLSAHLSGASEMPQGDDLEAMIARLDEKWRELKKILRAQEPSLLEEMPDSQVCLDEPHPPAEDPDQEDDDTIKSWWNSLMFGDKAKFGVTSQETDAIIQRLEKLDEDAKIRERLAKIEKQNFSLTVYAIACTLLVLFMVVSSYFFQSSYAVSKNSLDQPGEPQVAAIIGVPSAAAATAEAPQATPQPTLETPAPQQLPTVTSTPQEPVIPQVEYVGSRTSNKYHYRSCKWAKYIGPRNERVFHSVAEAQKAGYIRCPTCRPPLTDEPQTSAR